MASLSSTYASEHRQWPSPWQSSLNPQFVASHRCLKPLSSPFQCRAIYSLDCNPRLCFCNSCGFPSHRQRSLVGFTSHSRRPFLFRAGSSDSASSPSPPSDPPPSKDESISGALSRVQDTVQIFFAVFLWMALFFWASAWDGRNGGKHKK